MSYSHELPLTRTFWQTALRRPFDADVRLVAPDLRAVARAVELGVGFGLLPTHACAEALREGRMRELLPVADLVPAEPWFLCTRRADAARHHVTDCVRRLQAVRR